MFTRREQKVLLLLILLVVIGLAIILARDYPLASAPGGKKLEVFVCGDVFCPGIQIVKKEDTFRRILGLAEMSSTASGSIMLEAMEPEQEIRLSVSIDKAGRKELESLPGIGPKLAYNIILHRREHGPFKKKSDLMKVKGIGIKKYEKIKNLIHLEEKIKKIVVPDRLRLKIPREDIACDVHADSTLVNIIERYGLLKREESNIREIEKIPVRFKLDVR